MGIDKLDYMMKGLAPATLTTLIANTGTGKTWFLVLLAVNASLAGFRVSLFVTEMNTDQMQDRLDAMLFGKLMGEMSYADFKSGKLSQEQEDKYFKMIDEKIPKLEPIFLSQATGVTSVASEIEQRKPDLVLIDGVYLMEDERKSDSDWLRVTHITRDLKLLSKRANIPILTNSQADKNTSKKTGPALGDISYAQAIAQDSDNILALFRDEVMIEDREMMIRILKQREGSLGKVVQNWDFTTMNFSGIYAEETEDAGDSSNNLIGVD